MLSRAALRIATQGVACVHNLMLGSFTAVGAGTDHSDDEAGRQPRYTPYHIRHRTEVAGFSTILHGDDRIYNNIFVQNYPMIEDAQEAKDFGYDNQTAGTAVFDQYPTYDEWIANFEMDKPADMHKLMPYHFGHLPVWINGNAYFNGAKAFKKETSNLLNVQDQVNVELIEKDGNYFLKTNLYDLLDGFETGIINSDILGYAFEPEQRFEDPDGTAIIFTEDYFGDHRSVAAVPGPFASKEAASKKIW